MQITAAIELGPELEAMIAESGFEINLDDWWSGCETDPVLSCEHIQAGGAYMWIQTTRSGLVLLNGKVVEPARKVAR